MNNRPKNEYAAHHEQWGGDVPETTPSVNGNVLPSQEIGSLHEIDAKQKKQIKTLEEQLLDNRDADLSKETTIFLQLKDIIGIDSPKTFEELLSHPLFLQTIEEKLTGSREQELQKGNKRGVDKYLFDPLNSVIDVKKHIHNWLASNKSTKAQVYSNDSLDPIPEDYFLFDDHNTRDLEKLSTLQAKFQNIIVDTTIPLSIQYTIYKAFERMPELQDKKVRFVGVDGFKIMSSKQHVMRSQVNGGGLLKELIGIQKKTDREYIIQVNLLDKPGIMTLPKIDAKGGVMTHEFAHSLDYDNKSASGVIQFLVGFLLSPKWVSQMERKTDETAIARGTGYELYKFRQEVLAGSNNDYAKYKKRTYLGPEEILYGILKYHKLYKKEVVDKVVQHIIQKDF